MQNKTLKIKMIRHVSSLKGVFKVDNEYDVDIGTAYEWEKNRWCAVLSSPEEISKVTKQTIKDAGSSLVITEIKREQPNNPVSKTSKRCGCSRSKG